jgi:precorrin-2 methylase
VTVPNTGSADVSLRQFLMRLSVDPMALAEFLQDPLSVIKRFALDEPGRTALIHGYELQMLELLLRRPVTPWPEAHDAANGQAADPERGSLTVVGTGIRTLGQLTAEAIAWIKVSDAVLYAVVDPVAEEVIRTLNPAGALSLMGYYVEGMARNLTYEAMVNHIVSCVKAGQRTCVALYGHPGIFAYPAHEAIRRLRKEGFQARMLPGISAEDCLFADLGVDPARTGCQSIEASHFLLYEKTIDATSALILWQVGAVGDNTYHSGRYKLDAFPFMISKLSGVYGGSHVATVYEAAILPGMVPRIKSVAIENLTPDDVTAASTLYVPPSRRRVLNRELASRLGFSGAGRKRVRP